MELIDLSKKIDEKRHGVTSLLDDMKKIHEDDGIELMVIVHKDRDGVVYIGTTYGNNAEMMGLLEIGKRQLLDEM